MGSRSLFEVLTSNPLDMVYPLMGNACGLGLPRRLCPLPRSPPALQAPFSTRSPAVPVPLVILGTAVLPGARQRPLWLRFASPCRRVTLSAARVPVPRHPPSVSTQVPGLLCDGVVGVLLPTGVCSGCIWDTDPYQILDLQIFPPVPSAAFSFCCCVDAPDVAPLGCFCRGFVARPRPAPGTRWSGFPRTSCKRLA